MPLPQYAILYTTGPDYGRRHRVLACTEGPTRRVTVQNLITGDIRIVPHCDVEFIAAPSK